MENDNGRTGREIKSKTVCGVVLEANKVSVDFDGGPVIYTEECLQQAAKGFNSRLGQELYHVENGQLIYEGPLPLPKPLPVPVANDIHLSGCAVRYEPAYPNAACNCGAESVAAKHYYKQVMTLLAEVKRLETNYCENVNFVCSQRAPKGSIEAVARRIVEEYRTGRRYGDGVSFDDAVKYIRLLIHDAVELTQSEWLRFHPKPASEGLEGWGHVERRMSSIQDRMDALVGRMENVEVYMTKDADRIKALERDVKLLRRLGVSYEKYRRVISAGVLSNEELAALKGS